MDIQEIVERRRRTRSVPSEEDLKHLPFRRAFVYGRVSRPDQVRDSEQSIKEIGHLVALARKDGYATGLGDNEVKHRVEAIQRGETGAILSWEDGEVVVDCRDLGISGQLSEGRRPGLAALKRSLEADEVGCLYLTEGMSRLSRDPDRVLSYQMLKLLKQHQCRVRTPDGLWNPAIERDWEYLADELEDAAQELKLMGKRLRRRRDAKAGEGRHVGCPVPPGYIVEIEGRQNDGRYLLGRWKPYPPHAEVVNLALRRLVQEGSSYRAAMALKKEGVVFPFFPPELSYMESRSQLRQSEKTPNGYMITPDRLRGLAQNPSLIGVWSFGGRVLIPDNHEAIVPEDLFMEAYRQEVRQRKPKGRAVQNPPLTFAGLLWCHNHPVPQRVSAHYSDQRYLCRRDYSLGQSPQCMEIGAHMLDGPLLEAVLGQLDFTPYAEEILSKLETDRKAGYAEQAQRQRRENELQQRIQQLRTYLGSSDPLKEETYWQLIKEAQAELEALRSRPITAAKNEINVHEVRKLLCGLRSNWESYPLVLRNRLLRVFLERVELIPSRHQVEATIVWKVGLRQRLVIQRPGPNAGYDRQWTVEEDEMLRCLWPSAAREEMLQALPRRSWQAMSLHAIRLGVKRQRPPRIVTPENWRPWTEEEDARLAELYTRGLTLTEVAAGVGRSMAAVACRVTTKGLKRPPAMRKKPSVWHFEPNNLMVMQGSGRER